ncbi:MAG TPA: YihY/virulence factor BrkB family protein [Polyangium sp.]|jgi:membrane protein|nr:YihY/virulence factor BrkB family protein [Polyangium sp.]
MALPLDPAQGARVIGSAYRSLKRLFHYLDLHDASRAASAMAFDAFLSIIPLFAVAGWALHRLRNDVANVLASVLRAAPPAVRAGLGAEFFRMSDDSVFVLAPLFLGAFLWISSAGASTAIGVFETMFVTPHRPWWKRRLLGMALVIGSIPAVALATTVGILLARVAGSFLGRFIAAAAPALIVTGLVAAFYRLTIRRPANVKRRVWPGAIVTVFLWAAVSVLFSYYVGTLAQYATLYGNLASVAVLLFWLWLISLSVLVGCEVNAQLEGVRDPADEPAPAALPEDPDVVALRNAGFSPEQIMKRKDPVAGE